MEKRILKLEIIISLVLLLMPLILIITNLEIRSSISNYAYAKNNFIFPLLLGVAGTMFLFNGTAYNSRWYNIILGLSLIGIALTPHLDYPIIHYLFASIFFLGSTAVMVIFSSKEQQPLKVYFASIIIIGLTLHFAFKLYSLFWAEWIGMLPITIHYLGESTGKLD